MAMKNKQNKPIIQSWWGDRVLNIFQRRIQNEIPQFNFQLRRFKSQKP